MPDVLTERYRIERELGQGGMAVVYLATDLKHDRTVAVKVLRPEIAAGLGPDRFLREIGTAANLAHPHILPLHDSGEFDGRLFYVMPFVDGESLRDRLQREGPLPIDQAVRIAREVAQALGYAHERGIVHRDLKPENIMLAGGVAIVMDFGIARAVSSAGAEQLTRTGFAIGTPLYMSPEQATGRGLDRWSE
jgi:eukaryotic-like serine/threonine-protein kinase